MCGGGGDKVAQRFLLLGAWAYFAGEGLESGLLFDHPMPQHMVQIYKQQKGLQRRLMCCPSSMNDYGKGGTGVQGPARVRDNFSARGSKS